MINRRLFLQVALPALGVTLVGIGPALSETLEDKIVRGLRRQGYSGIKTSRTFLGRLRVTADKGENQREVILNRQTGEVLRDVIVGRGGASSIFDWDNHGEGKRAEPKAGDKDRDGGDDKGGDKDHDGGGDGGDSGSEGGDGDD